MQNSKGNPKNGLEAFLKPTPPPYDQFLRDYIQLFYGYGSYNAPYWFICKEERGEGTLTYTSMWLNGWFNLGRSELLDYAKYWQMMQSSFIKGIVGEPTMIWGLLLKSVLNIQHPELETTPQVLQSYQKDTLGRKSGENCLLNLLPLPAPADNTWPYKQQRTLAVLQTRQTYEDAFVTVRSRHLKNKIGQYKPKAVIFYGLSERELIYWKQIVEVDLVEQNIGLSKALLGNNQHSTFVIVDYPNLDKSKNEAKGNYFGRVGQLIENELKTK